MMNINRDEIKRLIDFILEQDALEVLDLIGYLNMKREKEVSQQLDVEVLSRDKELIRQIQNSREDRENGRIYGQEPGVEYLHKKVREFDHGQSIQ